MSILHTNFFSRVEPYFRIEAYAPDTNRAGRARIRIELQRMPGPLHFAALSFRMPCVACARLMHPFRERRGGHVYYAPTCPLDVSIRCSRCAAASAEYEAVRAHFGR